jgi:cell division protein ZapE
VQSAYERLLAERGLAADPAQQAVVDELTKLSQRLAANPAPGRFRRRLARAFPKRYALPAPRGLYIWGSVGRGKTWLMDLFYNEVSIEPRSRSHFHHLMRDVHTHIAGLERTPRPLEQVARWIAARARLLCLDELFVSDIGDAMILHGLFAGLIREGVTLVVTSNVPPAGLYAGGLQRERFLPAIALLEEHLQVVQIGDGIDYRFRLLEQASTYVLGTDAQVSSRLGALFERLANDGKGTVTPTIDGRGRQMLIEGRAIPLLRAAAGMAWFEFSALCEGARSQLDYIEIARELHTVFLSGVPVMDALNDDAARRFIALVDEFYDRNVKLVIGAAAEPPQLYRGERLKFAFERTASRLIEMRSLEYLAREHRDAG